MSNSHCQCQMANVRGHHSPGFPGIRPPCTSRATEPVVRKMDNTTFDLCETCAHDAVASEEFERAQGKRGRG